MGGRLTQHLQCGNGGFIIGVLYLVIPPLARSI